MPRISLPFLLLVLASGCGARTTPDEPVDAPANPTDPVVEPSEPEQPVQHVLKGTLEKIELQNINKSAGHYTYNLHLFVRYDSIEPSPAQPPSGSLKVRAEYKPKWGKMSDAERASLSTEGPKSKFTPAEFRGYKTGEPVDLQIRFSSPDLAHIIP